MIRAIHHVRYAGTLLWMFLLLCCCAHTQKFAFRFWTQDDGLGNMTIQALVQDRAGFLWIGTENGLFRFDGLQFERIGNERGLEAGYISALYVDAGGRLWVGTTSHLYEWNGRELSEILYQGKSLPIWQGHNLTSIDEKHVAVVSERRPFLIDRSGPQLTVQPLLTAAQEAETASAGRPDKSRPPLRGPAVHGIIATRRSDLWMGCGDSVCIWHAGTLSTLEGKVPPEQWAGFLEDHRGRMWLTGATHIVEVEPEQKRVSDHTPGSRISYTGTGSFAPLIEDQQGNVLTAAASGLLRWNGSRWQEINQENGFEGEGTNALFSDREGNLWIGTPGQGLVRWEGYENLENWTTAQGLPDNTLWSFLEDSQGRVLIGTSEGVSSLDRSTEQILPLIRDPSHTQNLYLSIAEDRSRNLWIGTFSGKLYRFDARTQRNIPVAILPGAIMHLLIDHNGQMWICTTSGLFVLDTGAQSAEPHPVKEAMSALGASTSTPNGCLAPDGTLWVESDHGLIRLRNGRWVKPTVTGAPPNMHFSAISCRTPGELWMGGQRPGLWRMEENGDSLRATQVTMLPGMEQAQAQALHQDRRGWLWVTSDAGVAVLRGSQWRLLNRESGLVWPDTDQNAFYESRDGTLWIGTSKGASHVTAPQAIFDPGIMQAVIRGIDRRGLQFPVDTPFSLPWSQAPLTFHLSLLSYHNRSTANYQYRLVGSERDDWHSTSSPEVAYAALPPGTYRFELTASNTSFPAASPVAAVSFTVIPPWWRSLAGILGEIVVLLLLIWGFVEWRIHSLQHRRKELEAEVALRTQQLESEKRDLIEAREQLHQLATRDSLTGLWNRRAIFERLEAELARSQREGHSVVLILADIDYFKRINDTWGHLTGDDVLRKIAALLQTQARPYDLVGRYGGEEFLLVLPGIPAEASAKRVALMHKAVTGVRHTADDIEILITMSFGAICVPGSSLAPSESLLRSADQALYRAKAAGRDRAEWADTPSLSEP